MGELSPWHWAIVIVVLVVLFGSRRLPDAARSIGRSARILKAELRTDEQDAPTAAPTATAQATPAAAASAAPPAAPAESSTTDSTITTSQSTPRHN